MFEFLKYITPKTKILFLSMIFILLPGVIISYLSLKSIQEKAENQRAKYHGTVDLVRDKLENEVHQLEVNLKNSVIESFSKLDYDADMKVWLRQVESGHPAFKNLFLANVDGDLITGSVSLGWKNSKNPVLLINPLTTISLNKAGNAEFISKNYSNAIEFYKEALTTTVSSQEHALLLSRIGRNYFKLGKYDEGIKEYKKILEFRNKDILIGMVPASIVALSQIAYGYELLDLFMDQYNYLLELYQQLINRPWDLHGGEYLYYLKSASVAIRENKASDHIDNTAEGSIEALKNKEDRLIEQIKFIELINQHILAEIVSELNHGKSSEEQQQIFRTGPNSAIKIDYFMLPPPNKQSQLFASGYQIDEAFIQSNLFPEILASVDLGKDISVGILDEKDSLLYHQNNDQLTNYLVAENFSHFLLNWKVALFDPAGKSIEQLSGKERQLYLGLFAGIIGVMLIGFVVLIRVVIHETELSRMKSEFVSNVTHELKTPLALIRMFGETLDSGIVTEEGKRREFYSIIRKESERLTHLINNVLDFSRMDTGIKEYNFEETDFVEVIRNSLEAYKFHIRDRGFEIESELPGEPVMLKIDKDAISQALLNLLSNAVKYSEKRKYILVEVRKNSISALISVTDHGVGIAKVELKKIFDKFYRVPNNKAKETRGSGLGLTLARHIVEAHGGTIEVDSEPGKGSRFIIRIPLL